MTTDLVLTAAHTTVHLPTCPDIQGRATRPWADGQTADEVRALAADAGLALCPTCKPLGTAVTA